MVIASPRASARGVISSVPTFYSDEEDHRRLISNTVNDIRARALLVYHVEDYLAIGDGVTDNQVAIQAAADRLAELGGGVLLGTAGKTYRIVQSDNAGHGAALILDRVIFDLQGAKLLLVLTDQVYGVRLLNYAQILNGEIEVQTGGGVVDTDQGIWQCNVSIGPAYGDGGTVASPSAHDSAKGWRIANLRLSTNRDGGYIIGGAGGINNGIIEQIEITGNALSRICIGFDWGTLGTIVSTEADMATNKTNYNAGTAKTTHPHNIVVRDINIGNMSRTAGSSDLYGCHALRLSGCHHILMENVKVAGVTFSAFCHTAGDLGYEYAAADQRAQAYKGIIVRNLTLLDGSSAKNGVLIDTLGDNVYRAQYSESYTPLVSPFWHGNILIEKSTFNGPNADSTYGARIFQAKGVTLRDITAIEWQEGVWFDEMSRHCSLEGVNTVIKSNRRNGVLVGLAELREVTSDITVRDALIVANATQGTYAGINVARGERINIFGTLLGDVGETNQDYGIFLQDTGQVKDCLINDNHVRGAVSVGYAMAGSTPIGPSIYRILRSFRNNTVDRSVGVNLTSGATLLPFNTRPILHRHNTEWYTSDNVEPAAGSWYQSESIRRSDSAASTSNGWDCVTSGTFGTLAGLTNVATTNGSKQVTMSLQSKTADTTESSYTITVNSATNLRKGLKVTVAASGIVNAEILSISGTTVVLDAQANATTATSTLTTAGVIVGEVISLNTTPAISSAIVSAIDGATVTLDTGAGSTESSRTASYTTPVFKAWAALTA